MYPFQQKKTMNCHLAVIQRNSVRDPLTCETLPIALFINDPPRGLLETPSALPKNALRYRYRYRCFTQYCLCNGTGTFYFTLLHQLFHIPSSPRSCCVACSADLNKLNRIKSNLLPFLTPPTPRARRPHRAPLRVFTPGLRLQPQPFSLSRALPRISSTFQYLPCSGC